MTNFFNHKMREKTPIQIVGIVIFGIIAITGLAILFGFILMWLWNWLMPEIFGLPFITYWQAVGLFILSKILIGGCGGSGRSSHKNKGKDSNKKSNNDFSKWRHYDKFWKEKGETMYTEYIEHNEKEKEEKSEE